MTGFFKKLFNRIAGRNEEPAPPPTAAAEAPPPLAPQALAKEPEPQASPPPAPEPALEPEAEAPASGAESETLPFGAEPPLAPEIVVESQPAPHEAVPKQPEVKAKARIEPAAEKPQAKKPVARKPEPKQPAPMPAVPKALPARKRPAQEPLPRFERSAPLPEPAPLLPSESEIMREPQALAAHEDVRQMEPRRATEETAEVEEPQPVVPVAPDREAEPAALEIAAPEPRAGWLNRLKQGLAKSSRSLTGSITAIFTKRKLDQATLDELEDVLIQADLGVEMTSRIVRAVADGRYDKEIEPEEVKAILASEVAKVLKPVEIPFNFGEEKPFVILVVGVNGSGKTTTIGKLAAIAASEGFSVALAACDTFRAAAIEQLAIWGKRIGARVISRPTGADAAGLAFDAMKEAKADATDILIIDTAGRLQNKANLMAELDKIVRVIKKQDETAPHAVLLVLDATTGQNAVSQADVFTKVAGVTGLIMTKLDGTARGGILVAIAERFKLPIHAIGVGERIEDLQPFDADAFSRAIAGVAE